MDIYSLKKVTAKKGDKVATFSEYNWNKKNFAPRRKGWKRIDGKEPVMIPEEVVKFKVPEKPADKPVGVPEEVLKFKVPEKKVYEPKVPVEEMKAHLDNLEIKYHPNIGAKKLEEKYNAIKERSV